MLVPDVEICQTFEKDWTENVVHNLANGGWFQAVSAPSYCQLNTCTSKYESWKGDASRDRSVEKKYARFSIIPFFVEI